MLAYLAFEYCKETEESHGFTLYLGEDGYYYLQTNHGRRGIYICTDEFVKNYRIAGEHLVPFYRTLEAMKIYSWKKAYPPDYVPEAHLMGCDVGSWFLDYRECGKRITRHIHGKGDIMETFPETPLLALFDTMFPDFDFAEWITEKTA